MDHPEQSADSWLVGQGGDQAPLHDALRMDRGHAFAPDSVLQGDASVARLGALQEIGVFLDAARTREDILTVLCNEARWVLPHDLSFICLPDASRSRFTIRTLSPLAESTGLDGRDFPIGEGVAGAVMRGHSLLCVDPGAPAAGPDAIGQTLADFGMRSLLAVPLRTGDVTIGCLAVASARSSAFEEEERAVAQLFATQVAIALNNASLLDDARKRIVQIELVNELAAKLTSTLELDDLLSNVAESVRNAFHYFDVTIFLINASENEVQLVAHAGHYQDFLPTGYRQKLGEGIVGVVASAGERILANDVNDDPRYIAVSYRRTRSELALPIRIHREVVGVLNVEDDRLRAFDETDATILETLCDQLGTAIHNAQLYEQLKRTNAKLTELDQLKSNFLGIVSHDFRSPLASIILAARSLLARDAASDNQRLHNYLTVIIDQATRLSNLAEDTLSIARMESGKLKCLLEVVNLERLIRDAAEQVKLSRRHTLSLHLSDSPVLVRADQSKLRQVVQNLLSNAVKYSPEGGQVDVGVEDYSADQFLVSVRDTGIGIPPGQMDRLFQKFSRIDSPQVREIAGSGLGLWICKQIVEAHGGSIWAESAAGKGSTFRFTLRKAQSLL